MKKERGKRQGKQEKEKTEEDEMKKKMSQPVLVLRERHIINACHTLKDEKSDFYYCMD